MALSTVIDLATRIVVGWSMASHMRTSLVTDALAMARDHGYLSTGAIFHSDRGSQPPRRETPGQTGCPARLARSRSE